MQQISKFILPVMLVITFISCSHSSKSNNKTCDTPINERDSIISKIIEYAHDSVYLKYPERFTGKNFYLLDDSLISDNLKQALQHKYFILKKDVFCSKVYEVDDSLHMAPYFFIDYLGKEDSTTYLCKLICAYAGYPIDPDKCYSCFAMEHYLNVKKKDCIFELERTAVFFH